MKSVISGFGFNARIESHSLRQILHPKFVRYNPQLLENTWFYAGLVVHADDVKRRLESNIFPVLGKRPLDQIEAPELLQAIRQ